MEEEHSALGKGRKKASQVYSIVFARQAHATKEKKKRNLQQWQPRYVVIYQEKEEVTWQSSLLSFVRDAKQRVCVCVCDRVYVYLVVLLLLLLLLRHWCCAAALHLHSFCLCRVENFIIWWADMSTHHLILTLTYLSLFFCFFRSHSLSFFLIVVVAVLSFYRPLPNHTYILLLYFTLGIFEFCISTVGIMFLFI